MEYNWKSIGERLVNLRKGKKWTQEKLIEKLANLEKNAFPIGRNSLSSLEAGNLEHCDLRLFTALCDLYDCELGYLLGEHEGKTRAVTDIHEKTGISFRGIDGLEQSKNQWFALQGLNILLEEEGCYTLDLIGQYLFNPDTYTILPNGDKVPTKSIIMIAIQRSLDTIRKKKK